MNSRSVVVLVVKVTALALALFVCLCLAFAVSGLQSPERLGKVWANLLLAAILTTAVIAYPILRSQWAGRLLVVVIFLVMLPMALIPQFLTLGVIAAGAFSLLAVLVLGKMGDASSAQVPDSRLAMPNREWAWKLAVVIAAYLALHSAFNYFILWRYPAVNAYHGGVVSRAAPANMFTVLLSGPWRAPLQASELVRWAVTGLPHVVRAVVWTVLALPIIRMMKGRWWEAGLAIGLLYAIPRNAQFLLPNPYVLDAVRPALFVERASAGLFFGAMLGWLFNRHHDSLRDLLRWGEPTVTRHRVSFVRSAGRLRNRIGQRIKMTRSEDWQCLTVISIYFLVFWFMPFCCCIAMVFVPIASFPSTETLATRYFHAVANENLEAATVLAGPNLGRQTWMREDARRDIDRFGGAAIRHVVIETAVSSGSDESLEFAVVEFEYREPGQLKWQPGRIHLETDHASLGPRFILENFSHLEDDSW